MDSRNHVRTVMKAGLAVVGFFLASGAAHADSLIIEGQSYYKLGKDLKVELHVTDKNGKEGKVTTATIDGAPTRPLVQDPKAGMIVYFKEKKVTDHYPTLFGLEKANAPYSMTVKYDTYTAKCPDVILDAVRDARVVVTWVGLTVGTATGSPLTCHVVGILKN